MRPGSEYFLQPDASTQRRYEALRAYFVEGASAAEVADRFGYSTASVHQMATLLRSGRLQMFAETKPGPKGPSKAGATVREKALALRADQRSVTEIAAALTAQGLPISAQTVWQILDAEGLPRLPVRDESSRDTPARLDPHQDSPADRLTHRNPPAVRANADITKAEQSREVIAFADYWQHATGADPGLLVFDSQLTTYTVLNELTARGIR